VVLLRIQVIENVMLFLWVITSLCFKRPWWVLQGQSCGMLGTCYPAAQRHIQEDWNLDGKKKVSG